MNKRKIISPIIAILLITSGIAGTSQQVQAAEQGNCSSLDDFVMFLTIGLVNAEDCSRQAYVESTIEDMKASDQNQSKVDIYSSATGLKSGSEAWEAPFNNYLNDTESVAWMKAEVAIAEAYEEGKAESQAKVAARQAIANYYAVKQKNLIEQFNVTLSQTQVLAEQANQEGLGSYQQGGDGVKTGFINIPEGPSDGDGSTTYVGEVNRTVTLVNGNTTGAMAIEFDDSDAHSNPMYVSVNTKSTMTQTNPDYKKYFRVEAPDSNYDPLNFFYYGRYTDKWNRIQTKNTNLQDEVEVFVNATWDDYQNGEISASDVISRNTAMYEYGVRSGSENETLYNSVAGLALAGFDVPNLNNSGTMTIQYDGNEYEGLMLARNVPNGSWETGVTYNESDFTGPVMIASIDGEKIDIADNKEFTILSMSAKDGSDLSTIETKKYRYKTSNTSELLETQSALLELRQEIEDREPSTSGSGTTTDSIIPDWLNGKILGIPIWGIAAGIGAIVFIVSRNQ